MRYFETKFLEEVDEFISGLDRKTNDPKLFKKLQIRLLAFWDKTDNKETLVLATHGLIKKVDKVPANEIDRAVRLRDKYFNNKQKK